MTRLNVSTVFDVSAIIIIIVKAQFGQFLRFHQIIFHATFKVLFANMSAFCGVIATLTQARHIRLVMLVTLLKVVQWKRALLGAKHDCPWSWRGHSKLVTSF